jgi:hypothetical protein
MTSVQSQYSQVQSNKLYVNIGDARSSIFTSTGTTVVPWVNNLGVQGQLSTTGSAVLRDLGKTLYLPSPTATPVGAVAGISTVFRKVQLIPTGNAGALGTFGTGGANAGTDIDYFTGYIQLSALQQGGGGNGAPIKFVRLN